MKIRIALFCIVHCIVVSEQISTPEDDHYWAGVVEFSSKKAKSDVETPIVSTAKNLDRYKQLINSPEADPVDIIVFPEYGLNVVPTASFVPAPVDRISPCNNLEYEPIVRDLSCLARARQKYLVVNLVEKALCPEHGDSRPCAQDGLNRFNTNVVFDRHGSVIARYRKFNLFGEDGVNVTVQADVVQFDTDFGVTFGTFTCFDLMFDQPALQLVRRGVTDIIFPTMWFSELPFLTGAQIQQAWAYTNNVNFLAAGASFPEVGSTGTGVYAGKRGRIVSVMEKNAEVKLYVAQVPKISRPQAYITRQPIVKYSPSEMANLKLKRDQIDYFKTLSLPLVSSENYRTTLCQNQLCCNFVLSYTVTLPPSSQQYYRYVLAVNDGKRTFDGFADGLITTCAVFACSGEKSESCAVRFEDPSNVVDAVHFNSIEVTGNFSGSEEVFLLPNSVDTSILPLEVDEIEYNVRSFSEDGEPYRHIEYKLVSPRSDLLTFAIWGRKFLHQVNGSQPMLASSLLVLFTVIYAVLVN